MRTSSIVPKKFSPPPTMSPIRRGVVPATSATRCCPSSGPPHPRRARRRAGDRAHRVVPAGVEIEIADLAPVVPAAEVRQVVLLRVVLEVVSVVVRPTDLLGHDPLGVTHVRIGDPDPGLDHQRVGDRQTRVVRNLDVVVRPVEVQRTAHLAGHRNRTVDHPVVSMDRRVGAIDQVPDALVPVLPDARRVLHVRRRRRAVVHPDEITGRSRVDLGHPHPHDRLAARVPDLDLVVEQRRVVGVHEAQIRPVRRHHRVVDPTRIQTHQHREVHQGLRPGRVVERQLPPTQPVDVPPAQTRRHRHRLGRVVGGPLVVRHGQRHQEVAGLGEGVENRLSNIDLTVPEVPVPRNDAAVGVIGRATIEVDQQRRLPGARIAREGSCR